MPSMSPCQNLNRHRVNVHNDDHANYHALHCRHTRALQTGSGCRNCTILKTAMETLRTSPVPALRILRLYNMPSVISIMPRNVLATTSRSSTATHVKWCALPRTLRHQVYAQHSLLAHAWTFLEGTCVHVERVNAPEAQRTFTENTLSN